MGIIFQVFRSGEKVMELSEVSIQDVQFRTIEDDTSDYHYPVSIRGLDLSGFINTDLLAEPSTMMNEFNEVESLVREIDTVRELINWAIVPAKDDYCMDVKVSITDAAGAILKSDTLKDVFATGYEEEFDDAHGAGKFLLSLQEMHTAFEESEEQKKQ